MSYLVLQAYNHDLWPGIPCSCTIQYIFIRYMFELIQWSLTVPKLVVWWPLNVSLRVCNQVTSHISVSWNYKWKDYRYDVCSIKLLCRILPWKEECFELPDHGGQSPCDEGSWRRLRPLDRSGVVSVPVAGLLTCRHMDNTLIARNAK